MKFSELWLREWVNPAISRQSLVEQLTLAGLEVDSITPVAADFNNVVVGEVIHVSQHPDADRLRVCQVNVGESSPLNIVCGAENVRAGLKVAVAKIGAELPGDFKIKKSKLRGVESWGMLCSESELGLAETSAGIVELSQDAPIGLDIRDYLKLNDAIIDIDLTPNRGDCLSIQGIAREVATLNNIQLNIPYSTRETAISSALTLPVDNQALDVCPHYLGRVIKNISKNAQTPLWMVEKLRRSDIRAISPIVDITNFVMLELGQPLHAFDFSKISSGIGIRRAHEGEVIHLLDAQTLTLDTKDLIITSADKPVALAGIKGGNDSGITDETIDIFLESALFEATTISRTSRKYGLITDSSHRFERGVDYQLQRQAIERASMLILEIAGGELGNIIESCKSYLQKEHINVREERISRILGVQLPSTTIESLLLRLGTTIEKIETGWRVIPPSYRLDINLEIDVIEEIARLYGYNNIPEERLPATLNFLPVSETKLNIFDLKALLKVRGYQEAITYSFVDPKLEQALGFETTPLEVINPIASDLAVMRTNLWPGLIKAYQYNASRQQPRIRLFEIGLCFINDNETLKQGTRLGGLCTGLLYKEQWGEPKRAVDFFDVKADVENILSQVAKKKAIRFDCFEHKALHPGKAAAIYLDNQLIGSVGALHPSISQKLEVTQPLYLFDIDLDFIMGISLPMYEAISKFPAIRRDVALVVTTNVPAERIRQKILATGGELLKNVQIFDVYQGKGIEPGKKSIALSLFFQHDSRTLVDAEINDFMQTILSNLHTEFNAVLRD